MNKHITKMMTMLGLFPTTAQQLATIRANQTQLIIPELTQVREQLIGIEQQLNTISVALNALKRGGGSKPVAVTGKFNRPVGLVTTRLIGVPMSVMQLEVGQTAVGKMTFDEIDPPADGAVASDSDAITVSLDADNVTWTVVANSVGIATVSYTGTSVAPDVGSAVVPPMVVTVVAVPVAEHGDFDPQDATVTGP